MDPKKYPEHIKVKAIQAKSQAIHEFIDFLAEDKKIHLAEWLNDSLGSRRGRDELIYARTTKENLIAEFFGINLEAFNKEKDTMYEEMVEEMNQRKSGAI
jgi:hypothetical protein